MAFVCSLQNPTASQSIAALRCAVDCERCSSRKVMTSSSVTSYSPPELSRGIGLVPRSCSPTTWRLRFGDVTMRLLPIQSGKLSRGGDGERWELRGDGACDLR